MGPNLGKRVVICKKTLHALEYAHCGARHGLLRMKCEDEGGEMQMRASAIYRFRNHGIKSCDQPRRRHTERYVYSRTSKESRCKKKRGKQERGGLSKFSGGDGQP